MFNSPKPKSPLQREIDLAFVELRDLKKNSKEYAAVLDQVIKMQKQQSDLKVEPKRLSPDTVVLAATNLLGIFLIIRHEHVNVITSKALAFVGRK